jgi:hypothetical protein
VARERDEPSGGDLRADVGKGLGEYQQSLAIVIIVNMHVPFIFLKKVCFVTGDGSCTSRRTHGGASLHSVKIGKPISIRPRSTRKKKPTLKRLSELEN